MKTRKEMIYKIGYLKYLLALCLMILSYRATHSVKYAFVALLEIISVACFSDICLRKNKILGNILNVVLILMINVQLCVLCFGGSFLNYIMLSNVESLDMLKGKSFIYIASSLIVIIISALPIREIDLREKKLSYIFEFSLAFELAFVMFLGNTFSPLYAYPNILKERNEQELLTRQAEEINADKNEFYKNSVNQAYVKPEVLGEKPNIILIFVEGLSEEIITDTRDIMPHLEALEEKSICFKNYYNHTFATYRGIIGQLFSGYQLKNLDMNNLVSLQSIMSDEGYHTSFINVEPGNKEFTGYLESLGFDEVINGDDSKEITDKEAYSKLFELANSYEQPFMMCMYSVGTHVSYDSPDEKYGDGKNAFLNKFYNLDYQLNEFMKQYENSRLADNTLVIITSDHCTYKDDDYRSNMNDYSEFSETGRIPLLFYYHGIEIVGLDAEGKNSLDMVPTILDYLDISAENYFLGKSLFYDIYRLEDEFDTTFYDPTYLLSTADCEIEELSEAAKDSFISSVMKYFSISR